MNLGENVMKSMPSKYF